MHKDLVRYAKALRDEPFAQGEYQTLLATAKSKLVDAKRRNLALESRFDLAYASAFGFALAALRRFGLRPNNQRWVVFQALPTTLLLSEGEASVLVTAHELRNRALYDGENQLSEAIVQELIVIASQMDAALSKTP
jgi:uncharacterized protein YutE (UPF0331/DUF86 family)